jgi:hypothetical protein
VVALRFQSRWSGTVDGFISPKCAPVRTFGSMPVGHRSRMLEEEGRRCTDVDLKQKGVTVQNKAQASPPVTEAPTAQLVALPTRRSRSPLWWSILAAIVVSLASMGVAIGAVISTPASGPTGATGATGPIGAQGPVGATGSQGIAGKQGIAGPAGIPGARGVQGVQGVPGKEGAVGPAGAVRATQVVSPTPLVTVPNAPIGTMLEATTSCPVGKVLLGGGAQVVVNGGTPISTPSAAYKNVSLVSSFPLTVNLWRTTGLVTGPLGTGQTMTMKPYVLCGTP